MKQYVDEAVDGPLTITIYPGADGAFSLYEDDGRTFDYRKGAWMRLAMAWKDAERRFTLRVVSPRAQQPAARPLDLRVAGGQTSRRVVFDGRPVDLRL